MSGPPEALVRSLVAGPSAIVAVDWQERTTSTNLRAAEAARAGEPEIGLFLTDEQTAGRGRLDRTWQAPAGTSLLASLLLRPAHPAPGWWGSSTESVPDAHHPGAGAVAARQLRVLPLLAGLALAEAVAPHLPDAEVALKWPNDLLLRRNAAHPWRKAAGILVELVGVAAIVGVGCNVDWRGVARPPELAATATSLAEMAAGDVDRWRVLAGFAGVFGRRYAAWKQQPVGFLDAYRGRCATLGRQVLVTRGDGATVQGRAVAIGADGTLLVRGADRRTTAVSTGDVTHAALAD
jgi:BirA family biotin operon repressor/biotin-[acetyl-CoA-carboxylase] ligase